MFLDSFDFSNKKIIVLGASSGIGEQVVRELDHLGADVIAVARREERLKDIIDSLENNNSFFVKFDLSELSSIQHLFCEICERVGKLDGLVYCAGISKLRNYKDITVEHIKDVFDINFFAYVECVRQFAKKNICNDYSKIVVISSIASVMPCRGQVTYAASKAGIDASIKSFAQEMIKRKIVINSVRPGLVDTEMLNDGFIGGNVSTFQPLGPVSKSDVSGMVVYLLSDMANRITGCSFDVDAGYLLKS